jgi:hypothetical protein
VPAATCCSLGVVGQAPAGTANFHHDKTKQCQREKILVTVICTLEGSDNSSVAATIIAPVLLRLATGCSNPIMGDCGGRICSVVVESKRPHSDSLIQILN